MKIWPLFALLFLTACSSTSGRISTPMAEGWFAPKNEQCVPFARRASGIEIYGDAHTWWRKAKPEKRMKRPRPGAVMVLAKTRRLSRGHLAVVKEIIDSDEITVTHTNWGHSSDTRRIVYESMRVKDISKAKDWSHAIFWNANTSAYGSPYKVSGFIKR